MGKGIAGMKKPKILVVGSMNMDLFVRDCNTIPGYGESAICGEYGYATGGKGSNQSFAIASRREVPASDESKQTDLLTPTGVREEDVSRVNGEQIRVLEGNRDCRVMDNEG